MNLIALFIGSSVALSESKNLKLLKPTSINPIDISEAAQTRYRQWRELFDRLYVIESLKEENLTSKQKKLLDEFSEDKGFWDTVSWGRSWYCGGGPERVKASSSLRLDNVTYSPKNAHDFELRTAWMEGVDGYGKGEFITYEFRPSSPKVTKILIYNGYCKSIKTWREYSRVKKLVLYINGQAYALLSLQDSLSVQCFDVEPLQSRNKGRYLTLKFEIQEAYHGSKYDHVAISEINFDGLDS
ncbi:MAG TPA: hypothetical protein VHR47_14200 [Bacillota bacterium]|nr:hypothetical protein [Bacillota bacterium]